MLVIHGRFTIIAVEKAKACAKQPQTCPAPRSDRQKAAALVLRPQSNRTSTSAANAAMAAQQDGFLREVDEALREQQVINAFKRHGRTLAIVIVAILVGVAGYLWWEHTRKAEAGERGEQLTIALDQIEAGRLDAGAGQLAPLAAETAGGSGVIARLMQAGILAEQGKAAEAQKAFAAIAADGGAPPPLRDIATLREAAAGFDRLPADQVVARLKPLAVPGKPFFGSAGELLGVAYMKQGRNDLAGPLFAAIARDKTVPSTLQRRARQMAGLLGVDAVDDVNAAASAGVAPAGAPAPDAASPAAASPVPAPAQPEQ